mgnify:CR=1 FL=1
MKGVVLGGGMGTRLLPLTESTNKDLVPVHDRPMICYPLECLRTAGIEEAMVVTGGAHAEGFSRLLGSGDVGQVHLMSRGFAVKHPNDLKGKSPYMWRDDVVHEELSPAEFEAYFSGPGHQPHRALRVAIYFPCNTAFLCRTIP